MLPPERLDASQRLPEGSGGEAGVQETTVPLDDLGMLASSDCFRRHNAPCPDLRWLNPVGKDPERSLAGPNFRRAGSPRYHLTIPGRLDILLRVPTVRKLHEEGYQF